MRFKATRTDRLSPQEREIVDRFERGAIDATEAGRLLIESVASVGSLGADLAVEDGHRTDDIEGAPSDETPDEASARKLVERLAQEVYDDLT
jgi:hypothetical protein